MLAAELDIDALSLHDALPISETFAAIRAAFDIPRKDDLKLRDYPTLTSMAGFGNTNRPDLAISSPPAADSSPQVVPVVERATVARPLPTADSVTATVLAIVAEKTGYPS